MPSEITFSKLLGVIGLKFDSFITEPTSKHLNVAQQLRGAYTPSKSGESLTGVAKTTTKESLPLHQAIERGRDGSIQQVETWITA